MILWESLLTSYCSWVPITDSDPTSCGRPQEYDASKNWAGKKVILISVPGKKYRRLSSGSTLHQQSLQGHSHQDVKSIISLHTSKSSTSWNRRVLISSPWLHSMMLGSWTHGGRSTRSFEMTLYDNLCMILELLSWFVPCSSSSAIQSHSFPRTMVGLPVWERGTAVGPWWLTEMVLWRTQIMKAIQVKWR
jgi:hypothetical protein